MLSVSSTTEEKVAIVCAPTTSTGNPAPIDAAGLTLEVLTGLGTIVQDPLNPNRFHVISEDLAGETTYRVSADADVGTGVVTISDTITYTYSAAMATNFGMTAEAPEAK